MGNANPYAEFEAKMEAEYLVQDLVGVIETLTWNRDDLDHPVIEKPVSVQEAIEKMAEMYSRKLSESEMVAALVKAGRFMQEHGVQASMAIHWSSDEVDVAGHFVITDTRPRFRPEAREEGL